MKIRMGTRGSTLALTQTATTAETLEGLGHGVEIVVIRTCGDKDRVSPFAEVGQAGIFVRELENAVLSCEVDMAVHSYKDLPSSSPEGLIVAAIPKREDPSDGLLIAQRSYQDTEPIPLRQGSKVGTASARRRAWLSHMRPDIEIIMLRGNVPTRATRVFEGDLDAVMLASAGVHRLAQRDGPDLTKNPESQWIELSPREFVPAPSQGALALQCRIDDLDVREALRTLDHRATRELVNIERHLLMLVQGGCDVPFGAHAFREGALIHVVAMLERNGMIRKSERQGEGGDTLADEVWRGLHE